VTPSSSALRNILQLIICTSTIFINQSSCFPWSSTLIRSQYCCSVVKWRLQQHADRKRNKAPLRIKLERTHFPVYHMQQANHVYRHDIHIQSRAPLCIRTTRSTAVCGFCRCKQSNACILTGDRAMDNASNPSRSPLSYLPSGYAAFADRQHEVDRL